ncbi:TPA: hypothetical protein ACKR1B_000139 [Pseudomonas aeruginosa]|uniref:hypothetical protein n=1 Tax=Pseudomonas aeruginosa TaxID=287 RepID=UPI0002CB08E4|nr:hypothetical protein [Pseudomonas aeruginosa]ENH93621.1 hypothetical protein H734_09177 [Pseudomonas aeruginosa PA45]MCS6751985.1 hypothetical protein [Pseudomonas aeruginosa]MDA3363885.1 hypothetical protein [Pseudomonas aeruginosa]MDV7831957.1 hypothetical protein [Pseudomonas aeruginosa]HCF6765341.1 hypothetical protein [Pseudomonas aeruginosa]
MSSTQLIEQCATRLRGIVEALDNIHDTSPQRWSTDLDDVHSSAESLLALINDQTPPSDAERWKEQFACMQLQRDHHRERADAALARVAELDQALAEKDPFGAKLNRISEKLERCDALLVARAALAGQVPQAWLDVQAERRRQVDAEGWTPEHDDAHSHGEMARAAACYALAGSSAPNDGTAALLVSLAWPWDEQWWKPTSARRDLVKACALGLAEIERLDRAGISQNPQPGATTASS